MKMIVRTIKKLVNNWLMLEDSDEVKLLEKQWQERLKEIQNK
jgi:hypothetical protein